MKKRRTQQVEQSFNDEMLFGSYEFKDLKRSKQTKKQQKNIELKSFNDNKSQQFQQIQQQKPQKSCCQKFTQKIILWWLALINFLQFDRILTAEQVQILKQQEYQVKTKYQEYYDQTYQQRSKKFKITVEEIIQLRKEEEQKKNKTFWNQFKRFICCQGANQLDETDQMLTAASQSQFFYINHMKEKGTKLIDKTLVTEHQKQNFPQRMKRQDNNTLDDPFDKFFVDKKEDDDIIFDDELDQQSYKKQIQKLKNDKKVQKDKATSSKVIEKTDQVLIKNNDQLSDTFENINSVNLNKKSITHQKNIERLDQLDDSLFDPSLDAYLQENPKNNKDTNGRNSRSTRPDEKNALNSSNASNQNLHKNQILTQNQNIETKKKKKNTFNFDNQDFNMNKNLQTLQDPSFDINNSDIISISRSDNIKPQNLVSKKNNKKKKRQIKKTSQPEDFKIDQEFVVNFQNQMGDQTIQQTIQQDDIQRHKHSYSTQQINSKKKKRKNRNNSDFNGSQLNQTIFQGKQDINIDTNRKNPKFFFQQTDPNNTSQQYSTLNPTLSQNMINAKKKKARSKKFQQLKQQPSNNQQVIVFGEDQYNSMNYNDLSQNLSQTLQTQDILPKLQNSNKSLNSKKKRKQKFLKDLNNDQTNEIVLQTNQMIDYDENKAQQRGDKNNVKGGQKVQKKRRKKAKLRQQLQKLQKQQVSVFHLGQLD